LEKNLAQHRVDEFFLRYKLEVFQKNFLDLVCGSPTSIKALDKDGEVEVGSNEIAHEEEI
jgi:hypothetical protein